MMDITTPPGKFYCQCERSLAANIKFRLNLLFFIIKAIRGQKDLNCVIHSFVDIRNDVRGLTQSAIVKYYSR